MVPVGVGLRGVCYGVFELWEGFLISEQGFRYSGIILSNGEESMARVKREGWNFQRIN